MECNGGMRFEIDLNQMRRNGCTAPTQETKLACRGDIAGLDAVYIEHIRTDIAEKHLSSDPCPPAGPGF
jgi:hypothetical protein